MFVSDAVVTLLANSFGFVGFLITSSRDLEDFIEQGIKIALNKRYLTSEQKSTVCLDYVAINQESSRDQKLG